MGRCGMGWLGGGPGGGTIAERRLDMEAGELGDVGDTVRVVEPCQS